MFDTTALFVATKTATLAFGGLLTYLSLRAYRRTGSPALRALAVGIGLVTAGAILGGTLHQLLSTPLALSVTVQSVFTAAGFGILTYSLYTDFETEPDVTSTAGRNRERTAD